jgi:hypothetical protein
MRRIFFMACFVSLTAGSAWAQAVEASIDFGYTASEGINASQSRIVLGQTYNSLDIVSGGNLGFTFGVFLNEQFEVEFLYSRQFSSLEISNPAPEKRIAAQDVDNYHGNLVYNWGDHETKVRPYAFFGMGATHYAPGALDASVQPLVPSGTQIQGFSKFSTTWGGGVKVYPNPHIGFKAGMRWTPTYIKTDPGGVWCDPFYPTCWVVGNPDYSNQFEFTGGVIFRFGGAD